MDFTTFRRCATALPVNISVLIRGDHGIGKSESVYQLAKEAFNLGVVERRLSQMSEGDMIGLPKLDDSVTRFMPPDWYKECCENPRLLFLDEINRATPEVMQAAFQIILDRTLNGHKLHPQTRVFAAINGTKNYQVNNMDAAFYDRFWIVDIEPKVEEWLAWASTEEDGKARIHDNVRSFIQNHPNLLFADPKVPAEEVQPSPRSWARLNQTLVQAGLISNPKETLFISLSQGLIGSEASIAFADFVKKFDQNITAEDILKNFDENEERLWTGGQDKFASTIEKLLEYLNKNEIEEGEQVVNYVKFFKSLPHELALNFWSKMVERGAEDEIVRNNTIKTATFEVRDYIFQALGHEFPQDYPRAKVLPPGWKPYDQREKVAEEKGKKKKTTKKKDD